MLARLRSLLCVLAAGAALGAALAPRPVFAADEFLEPDKAFRFSARALDDRSVEVSYAIAPGYYLYREQFKFSAGEGTRLGPATIPPGHTKFDETFQKNVETYRGEVRIVVPVEAARGEFRLTSTSQGCADAGLCYPPMQSVAAVSLAGFGGSGTARVIGASEGSAGGSVGASRSGSSLTAALPSTNTTTTAADMNRPATDIAAPVAAAGRSESAGIESVLRGGSFWAVVGAFFVGGLLLSLTPCVLPMLPIVSSIIVGHGGYGAAAAGGAPAGASRGRGLLLAASYSLGMALVYTAFGIAAGLAGEGLAAALQTPWVLTAFALGLVLLSLSMFGVYELQLPSAITGRATAAAQSLPAGKVLGVCVMGGVSALIVSPCVAAPLAGALLYLSQTRDVVLGGTALFSLAAGMSVPLLLVGASAGALLPRAGAWMDEVKAVFGVLLLGVALWTVQPVLPATLVLALWGVLAFATAAWLARRARIDAAPSASAGAPAMTWRHAVAGLLGLAGVLQIVGAAAGGTDPLQPLAPFIARGTTGSSAGLPHFTTVRSVRELDEVLRTAGRPAMLDFYADWCVSCKEMERYTFTDPAVQRLLAGALLLKADVTAHNDDDKALLKRFQLFGPPGTIFFDAGGHEVAAARLIGFQNSDRFVQTLRAAGL